MQTQHATQTHRHLYPLWPSADGDAAWLDAEAGIRAAWQRRTATGSHPWALTRHAVHFGFRAARALAGQWGDENARELVLLWEARFPRRPWVTVREAVRFGWSRGQTD